MKKRRFITLALTLILALTSFPAIAESTETRLTDFVSGMMSGDHIDSLYAQLDATMQETLPKSTFESLWPQLELYCGAFLGYYGDTETVEIDGYTVLIQRLDMAVHDLKCTLSLDSDGLIAGLYITPEDIPAPTAAPPAKVTEEKVSIGESPWKLPGTLLIPESDTRVPAVVLVQGSGATNRDEAIYSVRPFRDIANALSAKGIAVLRYDKRTYVYREKITASSNYRSFTVEEEVIQDAIAAGKLLASDERVDPERIFIMGHSLGAMLAPRIVSESGDLFHGMILASGTNKSFLDILLRQAVDSYTLSEKERANLISDGEAIFNMTEEESKKVRYLNIFAYYYWEMLQHPTAAQLMQELAKPTLIINGKNDIQVTDAEGRETWEQVLDMDAPWLTCYWTDVNHMLMRPQVSDSAKGTVNEYKVQCTVAEDITDMMAAFILNTEE